MSLLAWTVQVPVIWLAWWLGAAPWVLFALLVAYIILGLGIFARRWYGGAWRQHGVLGRNEPVIDAAVESPAA